MVSRGHHGRRTGVALSLSDLVAATAVPASTVHYYLRAGLIPPPCRDAPNRFSYDERHVVALRFVRALRDRGLGLEAIARRLPALLARNAEDGEVDADPEIGEAGRADVAAVHERILAAATEAFQTHGYAEVTVSGIAEAAGVSKGGVYRCFSSKEDLFTATVERLLCATSVQFAAAVERLGGAAGLASDPQKTGAEFASLVAEALPMLLETGARAAKGHEPSQELAQKVLRTLAEAAGRPLAGPGEDPVPAGLTVIMNAFAVVMEWAVAPEWPPDVWPGPDAVDRRPRC